MRKLLLLITLVALARGVEVDPQVKLFPFIKYEPVWQGTPAAVKEAAVPAVLVVFGKDESPRVVAAAGKVAFYLGQWAEAAGINPKLVKEGRFPRLLVPEDELPNDDRPLIVVGTRNGLTEKAGLNFSGPALKVMKLNGRQVLFVGGRNDEEVVKAASVLADRIIAFKAGAYTTFFSWVKLRGYLEYGNFTAALDLIKDPRGLSACGRNMSLAAPMIAKFPPEVKKVLKRRNAIMYKLLPQAVKEKDRPGAIELWYEATKTCFACHHGKGIPQVRKFTPLSTIHSRHQRIAASFGLKCADCHKGETAYRGYER
ncbi:MAG: cellulose biosynthesis cyclic di-GMP-binding regulatory protein BcsB [Aquificae bacterium]|nr:cellulose biosynthesis cyclic di-GMP-binding regulatory protein BcsB [Aquificota bacterium]